MFLIKVFISPLLESWLSDVWKKVLLKNLCSSGYNELQTPSQAMWIPYNMSHNMVHLYIEVDYHPENQEIVTEGVMESLYAYFNNCIQEFYCLPNNLEVQIFIKSGVMSRFLVTRVINGRQGEEKEKKDKRFKRLSESGIFT